MRHLSVLIHPLATPAHLFSPPRHSPRRVGFFVTTPAVEGQLELDLAEGKCPLDSQDIAITLFTFDAIDPCPASSASLIC